VKFQAEQDAISSRCRWCGVPCRMLWTGQRKRGTTWYASFRLVEGDGEDQTPHRCPRSWRVMSTREVKRFSGSRSIKLAAKYEEDAG
jgi:hypothetical protein